MFWPDAELMVFPLPWPIRARTLVIALLVLDLALALFNPGDGVAHVAHLGGAAFGYLFFRFQAFAGPGRAPRARSVERPVMVQSISRELDRADTPVPRPPRPRDIDRDEVAIETDRLLDKISGQGLASLTPAERKFLDEVSKRKRH